MIDKENSRLDRRNSAISGSSAPAPAIQQRIPAVKITVILCTYNRCQSLAKTLEKLALSILPHTIEWEVLVVDNNSNDETRSVVEEFCRRYPSRFRYTFELRQGKSYALNSGIQEAKGEVLAFVDDDLAVEPTWLQNLTTGLCDGEWAGAGGRILPEWSCTPPSWLPLNEWSGMAPLGMFDLGFQSTALNDAPFGGNMAFHRRVFEKYGVFRTDLGPRPGMAVRNNEDTEFGRRLLVAGERLKYEPLAVVRLAVPQDRLEKRYFLRWWFNKARADVRETGVTTETKWLPGGIPLRLFRRLAVGILRWLVTLEPSERFRYRTEVWFLAGIIVESYQQARRAEKKKSRMNAEAFRQCP